MGVSNTESTNASDWKGLKWKITSFNVPVISISPPASFKKYKSTKSQDLLTNKLKYLIPDKSKKELENLFEEFAQEDKELAELGLEEYNEILLSEDNE